MPLVAEGGSVVDLSAVVAAVAAQCRQLLGLDLDNEGDPVEWSTTGILSETESALVCMSREGEPLHSRVLALLRQLLHLANDQDDVLIPPTVAEAAEQSVALLRRSVDLGGEMECGERLALQLEALGLMTNALADPQLLPQAHIPQMHRIAIMVP